MTRLFRRYLIAPALSAAVIIGCTAFAEAADTTEAAAGPQNKDILPTEDTSLGAMHFEAPAQYDSVRRDTFIDSAGAVTEKSLRYSGEEGAWTLTLDSYPVDPPYDMKAEITSYFSEEAVSEGNVGGQTAMFVDDGDELYAFILHDDVVYYVSYDEKTQNPEDKADKAFFDSFLSTLQFSGSWEDSIVNDDVLGSMGYTAPDLEYSEKTIYCLAGSTGNLEQKHIRYSFESGWDRLFLEWHPGQTFEGYLSEHESARETARECEYAGISGFFVPYDEEQYGDSLGGYYFEREDGLYEIYSMFDPVTEQKEEMLQRLLNTISFSDTGENG